MQWSEMSYWIKCEVQRAKLKWNVGKQLAGKRQFYNSDKIWEYGSNV